MEVITLSLFLLMLEADGRRQRLLRTACGAFAIATLLGWLT